MTKDEIADFILRTPVTNNGIRVDFTNKPYNVGFFDRFDDTESLKEENKWRFVPNNLAPDFMSTRSLEYTIIIDGNEVSKLTVVT